MKIFKHIKTSKLYIIQTSSYQGEIKHVAIPCGHDGPVLINVSIKEFVPHNSGRN